MTKPRWRHDAYILDNSVVGVIEEDAFERGWWAYGCMSEWQDTKLGLHETPTKAKRAVQEWVEEND